ncbi:hypothetical protein ACIRPT_39805 [Streptomyces sp. NPDC101227]|uniref:hypothetical protein n=1 Tax=Streptomyces sp. NPDC101227 TaxID=3366136 RepID=UPI00382462EB
MIWSSEDLAREVVRRQAAGMPAARVAKAVAQAAVRERETAEELRSPGPVERGLVVSDLEELAGMWAARHVEWRRVQVLMEASGWAVYEPELDSVGSAWAAERVARRVQAIVAHAARLERRREAVDEVRMGVWLPAGAGRLLRQAAARAGLTPQEVLAQLAARRVVDEGGAVSVEAFVPSL